MSSLKKTDGSLVSNVSLDDIVKAQVQVEIKYEGYINRQKEEVMRQIAHQEQAIPNDLDFDFIDSLSIEVRQKLKRYKPKTIGQASRISGITPAAISLIMIHVKRFQQQTDLSHT